MVDNIRKKRIGGAIQKELGKILLNYPRQSLFNEITITEVDVAPDLSTAKVFFIVFDETDLEQIKKILQNEAKVLRKAIAGSLNLRLTPRLNFIYDDSVKRGMELSDLINAAVAKDEENHET